MPPNEHPAQYPDLTLSTPIKFLAAGHRGPHSGFDYTPYLPEGDAPGKWLTVRGRLRTCERGIHYTTPEQGVAWLREECWRFEPAGVTQQEGDKWVTSKGRLLRQLTTWNSRTQRLFACDCAEHVLPLYERRHPNDARPRNAIAVARRYATGEASVEELRRAQVAAAAAAADAYAAGAAADAYAPDATADDAAAYAPDAGGGGGARRAEREWQGARLLRYLRGELR